MAFQTEALPLTFLEHSNNTKQRELFASWRSNNLQDAVQKFAKDIVLLSYDKILALPIELYRGHNSLAQKVLGQNWQSDLKQIKGANHIVQAYELAHNGEPTYQYVYHTGQRRRNKFAVRYERLVLPLKSVAGIRQIVTLSTLVSIEFEPIETQNHDNDFSPWHKTNNQILLGKEQYAS